MVKLICGIQNHELAKSLVGHPYVGWLTKAEKIVIADMTKSMVKPRNILLTLKEHNANSCTTIKQIYNAKSSYRSSIIVYSLPRHVILSTPTCYWSSHHRGQSLHPKVKLYGNNQRLFMVHFQPLSIYPLQSQTLPYKAMVMSTTPTPSKCFQMDFNRSHN